MFQPTNTKIFSQIFLTSILLLLTILTFDVLPAKAIIFDSTIVNKLKDRRQVLLEKERDIRDDVDDLSRQIDDLRRANDTSLSPEIHELNRKLNEKYSDLKEVRFDLHDIETRLI